MSKEKMPVTLPEMITDDYNSESRSQVAIHFSHQSHHDALWFQHVEKPVNATTVNWANHQKSSPKMDWLVVFRHPSEKSWSESQLG